MKLQGISDKGFKRLAKAVKSEGYEDEWALGEGISQLLTTFLDSIGSEVSSAIEEYLPGSGLDLEGVLEDVHEYIFMQLVEDKKLPEQINFGSVVVNTVEGILDSNEVEVDWDILDKLAPAIDNVMAPYIPEFNQAVVNANESYWGN